MYSDHPRSRGGSRVSYRSGSGGFARQNAAPYSRPVPQRSGSSQANVLSAPQQTPVPHQQTPPQQSSISIRGASSIPTQALVSNLAKGTSAEDVRQTFLQFGDIIRVKERQPATDSGSVSYEVLFEERSGAKKAVEHLDRALADGRILSVVIEEDPTVSTPTAPSRLQRSDDAISLSSPAPSPAHTPLATPLGPRSIGSANGGRGAGGPRVKELFNQQEIAGVQSAAVLSPRAGAGVPRELLQTRTLTAKERRAVATAQAQAQSRGVKKNGNVVVVLPSVLPKGPKAQQQPQQPSLQARLGGLPLAQRLGEVKGPAKSDLPTLQAKKSKQVAKKAAVQSTAAGKAAVVAAAGAAAGAASTATGQSASQKRRQKAKAKKATAVGGSAGGMDVD